MSNYRGAKTLEEAIAEMGNAIANANTRLADLAKKAVGHDGRFEVVLTVTHDKNGYVVNASFYQRERWGTFGTLLRLTEEGTATEQVLKSHEHRTN